MSDGVTERVPHRGGRREVPVLRLPVEPGAEPLEPAAALAELLPQVAAGFSTTIGSAAIIVTAFTVGYGLFQLVFGPVGEATSRKATSSFSFRTARMSRHR